MERCGFINKKLYKKTVLNSLKINVELQIAVKSEN